MNVIEQMAERERWTDERLDDFARQVWREFDDIPTRMTKSEARELVTAASMQRIEESLTSLRADFNESRRGLTRAEKIALFSALIAFFGLLFAALVTVI